MFIVMYEENVILSLIEVILVSLSLGFSQYGISNWVYYLYMFTLIGFLRQKNLKGLVLGLIICSAMLYQPLFECNGFSRSCDNNVCLTKFSNCVISQLTNCEPYCSANIGDNLNLIPFILIIICSISLIQILKLIMRFKEQDANINQ